MKMSQNKIWSGVHDSFEHLLLFLITGYFRGHKILHFRAHKDKLIFSAFSDCSLSLVGYRKVNI